MFATVATRLAGLRARYAEPHRAYHTQAHVDAMLGGLHGLGGLVTHGPVVELAIWYHDAIYDLAATDNEARSADLLRAELDGVADPALLDCAERFVRAIAGHTDAGRRGAVPSKLLKDSAERRSGRCPEPRQRTVVLWTPSPKG